MKGKYGVPMNGIEKRVCKHYCRQCIYAGRRKNYVFCKIKKRAMQYKVAHLCKYFKKNPPLPKASEATTHYVEPNTLR